MTDERRFALVIACDQYNDPKLKRLKAPQQDAKELEAVLKDPSIGDFEDVKVVLNQPYHKINEEIFSFFNDRKLDDLALLYFAGHGIKGEDSELYFAGIDTRPELLTATAISSNSVNKASLTAAQTDKCCS
jgi:uncharacterized caspase-like protein